ncbi:MAG: hypothetical protein IPH32_16340 [Bacteroidetes bacterium]|nr:hypothetical protein [Bacteroidota bacterium]
MNFALQKRISGSCFGINTLKNTTGIKHLKQGEFLPTFLYSDDGHVLCVLESIKLRA